MEEDMSKKKKRREEARLKALKKEGMVKEAENAEAVHGKAAAIEKEPQHAKKETEKGALKFIEKSKEFFDKNYKLLLLIPLLILVLSLVQIGVQVATTGDFIIKGVSLKGGTTITVPGEFNVDINELQNELISKFPGKDISVRSLTKAGKTTGLIIDSEIEEEKQITELVNAVKDKVGSFEEYDVTTIGSALGKSFFKETFKAIAIAFIAMGCVVFLYFGTRLLYKIITVILTLTSSLLIFYAKSSFNYSVAIILFAIMAYLYLKDSIPSVAVISAAFCDMIMTIAIINLMGIRISGAGIAALLMLIGYSVDTDILLSTRVLKRKEGTVTDRVFNSMKTGLTMTFTAMAAVVAGLVLSGSDVLTEIMTIVLIGLFTDIINTWMLNAGILKWYVDKEAKKGKEAKNEQA